ncbi:hypothetical protein N7G274_010851 [Stereocaulon virgatum]|uniref:Bacterial repeat domain-containing protein n=1 Tax=Stereocaulon virgatum TaxID=373712 RepID=A0ABR3ZTH6_9LECA
MYHVSATSLVNCETEFVRSPPRRNNFISFNQPAVRLPGRKRGEYVVNGEYRYKPILEAERPEYRFAAWNAEISGREEATATESELLLKTPDDSRHRFSSENQSWA